jgi:hypothetical protein
MFRDWYHCRKLMPATRSTYERRSFHRAFSVVSPALSQTPNPTTYRSAVQPKSILFTHNPIPYQQTPQIRHHHHYSNNSHPSRSCLSVWSSLWLVLRLSSCLMPCHAMPCQASNGRICWIRRKKSWSLSSPRGFTLTWWGGLLHQRMENKQSAIQPSLTPWMSRFPSIGV